MKWLKSKYNIKQSYQFTRTNATQTKIKIKILNFIFKKYIEEIQSIYVGWEWVES